jgi:uncharacterized membrane protein YhfC
MEVEMFELVLLAVGITLLVFGYRRNNRNVLLLAALVLLAAGALPDVLSGIEEGYRESAGPAAAAPR